ncbi:MAG: glutamine--fructose-6-phosphate transaminase (isomerizing) [archaeon]
MCGITAYAGERNAKSILLEGLKKLEYRGYDSCGIAIIKESQLNVIKAAGRIEALEKKTKNILDGAKIGIAHTRWATHGIANERNAHPHTDCSNKIAIVHNGIIENYSELKTMLKTEGHKFRSETDTEVLAHMVEKFLLENNSLEEAFINTMKLTEGAYAVAMISSLEQDKIFAAKKSSPLVIGIGKKENFIASDATVMLPYTDKAIFLKDNEIAIITALDCEVKNLERKSMHAEITQIRGQLQDISKKGFADFMLKEIIEQPASIENAFKGRIDFKNATAKFGGLNIAEEDLKKINRIILLGCGTSYHACLYGKYLFENVNKIPSAAEYASEFCYSKPFIDSRTLIILLSQSGETADAISALKYAKSMNAKTLGIVNVVGSTIAREVDGGIYLHAGPEIAVASTKTFTSHLVVLYLFSVYLARLNVKISKEEAKKMLSSLQGIPSRVKRVINSRESIEKISLKYFRLNNALYLARGFNYPIALEGALKLKEISYIHAEAMTAAEMKHGPIALIDKDMFSIFIAPNDLLYKKNISNISEIKSRNGKVIAITNFGNEKIKKIVDDAIFIPKTDERLMPIVSVIPTQLISYYAALMRGCDVDKPRNLAKSVTVE